MDYLSQLDKMLNTGHRLIAMESYEVERICDLLLELSRFNASPFYLASPGQGMYRFGASHISIPRTVKPEDLIEHIKASTHYGVFILRDYNEILKNEKLVDQLLEIATGESNKVVLFIADHLELPEKLRPKTLRSKHQMKKTG